MDRPGVVRAYRHLFREGLRAVQYSKPARFTLQTILRSSFRSEPALGFDQERVDNTLQFLRHATRERAVEHKIVKNLMTVRYWQFEVSRENRL